MSNHCHARYLVGLARCRSVAGTVKASEIHDGELTAFFTKGLFLVSVRGGCGRVKHAK